jgi:hypothetical protein
MFVRADRTPLTPLRGGAHIDRAFGPVIWPILGIIFLPLTTLLYVILWNTSGRGVDGWEWILVILAVFADLASYGGGVYGRRRSPAY